MTEKLDNFSKDILSFLEKHEPERVRWREIAEGLFPSYKFNYKNERVFGIALTQKLKFLTKKGLIIKEGDFYGTLKSKSPIEKKPSTEVKPSKFGFFEYWHRKAEREQREQLIIHRENLLRAAQYCELVAKVNPQAHAFDELAKNYREQIKELDKELGYFA